MTKILTDEQYQLLLTAAAQIDYAAYHGDEECMAAAAEHAAQALRALGELTAEDEEKYEDEDDWEYLDDPSEEDDWTDDWEQSE